MARCPKGHESVATDYCDECGTPMGGQPAVPVSAPPVGPPVAPPVGVPAAGVESCPSCGNARAGGFRFCEVCGYDFVLGGGGEQAPAPAQQPESAAPAQQPESAAPPAADLHRRTGTPPGWRVLAVADPAYHARMQELAGPDVPPIPFPAYCPERRFPVRTTQLLIGRRRPSRGIEPDVDLTGPPEDAAVSHSHALLVAGPDGDWSVVDLASANGTYVNDSTEAIEPHIPVPVKAGDRIHVGAWTTLTVQREEAGA